MATAAVTLAARGDQTSAMHVAPSQKHTPHPTSTDTRDADQESGHLPHRHKKGYAALNRSKSRPAFQTAQEP